MRPMRLAGETPMRLAALAERLGLAVEAGGDFPVEGTAPLETAGPGDLSFVGGGRWVRELEKSRAGALIVGEGVDAGGRPAIRSSNPRLDFARAVALLHPRPVLEPGVHPSAQLADGAEVDASAHVGAGALIGAGTRVGPGCIVHAGAVLYPDVVVGADCVIHSRCVLREGTRLGDRVVLQPGVVIGGDGFGYELDPDGRWVAIPHSGRVVLEDEVEIGAGTTVDRGTYGETWIGRGAKIDNLVQIGHNCRIGAGAVIVAQSGLSGSTRVGERAILMARTGSKGHLTIGDGAFVGARTGVHKDVPAGAQVFGTPHMEGRTWHRVTAAMTRLPDALRRLRALERELEGLERKLERPDGDDD